MDVITLTPPVAEPLTLDEAKTHLRVAGDAEDPYIEALIVVARSYVESTLGCALLTQTLRISCDGFPCDDTIRLPRWPVQSISSVKYVPSYGDTELTWTSSQYVLKNTGRVAYLRLGYNNFWPATRCTREAVTIDLVAGFDAVAKIPTPIIHAMKLLVGHFYEMRQPVITGTIVTDVPMSVNALLSSQSVGWYQ